MRDPLRQVRLPERHAVEEAQRADRLVQRRPRHAAGDEMHLEGAHVLQVEHSGERPKKRPNLATACTYDRCVAGDRLRTVMSSIMRRRRGLISVIGGLPSRGWVSTRTLADGRPRHARDRRPPLPRQRFSSIPKMPPARSFAPMPQPPATAGNLISGDRLRRRPAWPGRRWHR